MNHRRLRDEPLSAVLGAAPRPVLALPRTATVREALQKLHDADVQSLVVDGSGAGSFLGLVSAFDLITHVLSAVRSQGLDGALALDGQRFNDAVTSALGLSLEGRMVYAYDHGATLKPVLDAFALGVHRVLVTTRGSAEPPAVLTQTDVARFVVAHGVAAFGVDPHATLAQLRLFEEPGAGVLTVAAAESALNGFNKLALNEVTAAAVVDAAGRLVGTLSVSDARGLTADDLADVALPVLDFLAKRPRRHAHQLVVRSATSVAEALATMTDEHVHRVWVVDGDNHPRGVVTMSDIVGRIAAA